MIWKPFQKISKSFLGIDIGTSSIKIVELSKKKGEIKLENYGELKTETLYEKPFRTFEKNVLTISCENVSRGIRAILEEAKVETRKANFSIPDFSSFFTTFDLPSMSKEEISNAVKFEAQRHIPIPQSEVTLDWQIIKGDCSQKKGGHIKILLVAVSNQIIHQYQELARLCFLELGSLEAEIFGLSRASVKEDNPLILLDIGEQSSTISAVHKRKLNVSHSVDIAGKELTRVLSKGLNLDNKAAEELKQKYGLLPLREDVRDILLPLINSIAEEVEKISQDFEKTENKKIKKIILAGAGALIPGLKEYFFGKFQIEVEIANPFSDIIYSPVLEENLKNIGPSYAIAVGTAMRGLE